MARHLLDSDVLISCLRGRKPALDTVKRISSAEVPAISALSYFEVWAGVRPIEEEPVAEFLSSLDLLPVDAEVARTAGEYVRVYRKKGVTLGAVDALIAATARVHRLCLITSNTRDFPMPEIEKFSP